MAATDICNSHYIPAITNLSINAAKNICKTCFYYLLSSFAHFWFPTVHDVLQADWHEAWHLPHPPFFAVALRLALLIVLICFI